MKKEIYEIKATCPMCGKVNTKEIEMTDEQFISYQFGFKLIQNVFPELSPMEREFLKSGYCDECQSFLFAPPEEEED